MNEEMEIVEDEKEALLSVEIVRKSNDFARAVWSPDTIWQMRILALLISKLNRYDKNFRTIVMPAVELLKPNEKEMPGGIQRRLIIYAARKLHKRTAEFYSKEGEFIGKPFFEFLRVSKDRKTLTAKFNVAMMPELLQLHSRFCKQDLRIWTTVTSTHTLQLYDLLSSWQDKIWFEMPIEKLHKKLNSPKSSQENFAKFENKILLPAQKTLAETAVAFTYTTEKVGRKIGKIKFYFRKHLKQSS